LKVRALVALFTVFCSMFLVWALPAQATTHRVCVDAGHGGTDPGAVYKSLEEKNVTLDIATRLQTLLQNAGYTVVMTRTSDMTLDNSQRAAICNNAHAEVLTSIHLNASSDHSIDYTLGLYGKINKDQAFAKTVNSAMSGLGISNNGISHFADGMLLKAVMPATLAETVFISSDYEYGLLTDGTGKRQQQIAQLLLQGINTWFGV
jgi:N-acetylmuramoyl-L-alanine amidase